MPAYVSVYFVSVPPPLQKFGFASCNRNVGAAEGVNVLVEEQRADGTWAYHVSCIEYTEFEKLGIADVPAATGR